MRRPPASIVMIALVAAIALAGCGSSGTQAWKPAQVTQLSQLAAKLDRTLPGECKDFAPYVRKDYAAHADKVASIPQAVGACSALTEDLEFSAFSDGTTRDKFIETRASTLCGKATTAKADLPGLYWVKGGDWSIQPDSEGVARRIAPILGGTYLATACPGRQAGWNEAGVVAFQDLAAKLGAAHLGCTDFELRDRDLMSHNPGYLALGLPAAMGECTLSGQSHLVAAILIGPSPDPAHFVAGELKIECPTTATTRVVRAGTAAIFVSNLASANAVGTALGAPVSKEVCG